MSSVILEAHDLTKEYRHTVALDHIDLKIEKGKIYGFIGQNGAGKTTFLRLVTGLAFPTSGTLSLWGKTVEKELQEQRKRIGCMIETPALLNMPELLILDEPTAGLDPRGCEDILALLRSYHAQRGSTVVLVSHSMEEIACNAQRIIVLSGGDVYLQGTPGEVFAHARQLETVGLDVPQVTKIAHALYEKGVPVDPAVYTVEALQKQLLALKGGRAVC